MAQKLNTLIYIQHLLASQISAGSLCIDATCGRGHDTAFLAQLVGEKGRVLAFDVQREAIESTRKLLSERHLLEQVQLYEDSHIHLAQYAKERSVSAIMFNLGYLPGGDHQLATKAETTIAAIKAGLTLLNDEGIMTLCIYHGGDSGFTERNDVLAFLREIDNQSYTVLVTEFYNRPNYPPLAAVITRN